MTSDWAACSSLHRSQILEFETISQISHLGIFCVLLAKPPQLMLMNHQQQSRI